MGGLLVSACHVMQLLIQTIFFETPVHGCLPCLPPDKQDVFANMLKFTTTTTQVEVMPAVTSVGEVWFETDPNLV
jgi:hypothetical protein